MYLISFITVAARRSSSLKKEKKYGGIEESTYKGDDWRLLIFA